MMRYLKVERLCSILFILCFIPGVAFSLDNALPNTEIGGPINGQQPANKIPNMDMGKNRIPGFYNGKAAVSQISQKGEQAPVSEPTPTQYKMPSVLRREGMGQNTPVLSENVKDVPKSNTPKTKATTAPVLYRSENTPVYEDSSVYKNKNNVQDNSVVIYPGVTNTIALSNTDTNDFVCPTFIKTMGASSEKGVKVSYIPGERFGFVKFQIAIKNGVETYASVPTEIFVMCGEDLYKIIAVPKAIRSITVRLSSGKENKIKTNVSLFSGMPLEKKENQLIKMTKTDNIPESFDVDKPNKKIKLYKNMGLTLLRTVTVEGEGLVLKEYLAKNTGNEEMQIDEFDFVKKNLTVNTLAVAIDDAKFTLQPGEKTKVYIVEQLGGDSGTKR